MKQAVVVFHGMGEQIPMQTLNAFLDAAWIKDDDLVASDRPASDGPGARNGNAVWYKPDKRYDSTEMRRVDTETILKAGHDSSETVQTRFFEFYWAHLIHGTTWEQVRTWIFDLLLRRRRHVPDKVAHAWFALWIVTLAILVITGMLAYLSDQIAESTVLTIASGALGFLVTAFVSSVLIKRFGDVVRYTQPHPENIDRRAEVRDKAVDLLRSLTNNGEFDRIIVVAHSLGTIVAYDALTILFAEYNTGGSGNRKTQPMRDALENMVRDAAKLTRSDGKASTGCPLDIDAYQTQQANTLREAQAQGCKWIISDFITLGSPLTHAEFLMAETPEDLRKRQAMRFLPTCPPTLEYDRTTKLYHFSYDRTQSANRKPNSVRALHHAAPFALTRWTNVYSQEKRLIFGDIVSGPVAPIFNLTHQDTSGEKTVQGIRDIAVLPRMNGDNPASGHARRCFTHNDYWMIGKGSEQTPFKGPDKPEHHISVLRAALDLRDIEADRASKQESDNASG